MSYFVCQGSLVGVCGSVGSGKSSLIQAVLAQVLFLSNSECFAEPV